jgi:hypothetical protein
MSNVNPATARNKDIIAAVIRGAKAGKSNKEVAAEVRLSEASFQTHTSNLRKVLGEVGFDLPKLGRSGSGPADKAAQAADAAEFARGLLAELTADDEGETDETSTVEGETDETSAADEDTSGIELES